jgi:hypothetical protein
VVSSQGFSRLSFCLQKKQRKQKNQKKGEKRKKPISQKKIFFRPELIKICYVILPLNKNQFI